MHGQESEKIVFVIKAFIQVACLGFLGDCSAGHGPGKACKEQEKDEEKYEIGTHAAHSFLASGKTQLLCTR